MFGDTRIRGIELATAALQSARRGGDPKFLRRLVTFWVIVPDTIGTTYAEISRLGVAYARKQATGCLKLARDNKTTVDWAASVRAWLRPVRLAPEDIGTTDAELDKLSARAYNNRPISDRV